MTVAASPARLQQFTSNAIREYEWTSVVKQNFVSRQAETNENGRFVRVGHRFLSDGRPFLDEYSLGNEYFSPEIFGLGRSVAIGEEKYLMKQLQRFFQPIECASKLAMIARLSTTEPPLSVAFIPLEYLNDFYSIQTPGMRLEFETGRTYLIVGHHRMRIYWSNKYVKFAQFFFLARDSIEWIVKPDPLTESWLQVRVEPTGMRQFEVTVETIALCNPGNINHGISFNLQERPMDAVFRTDVTGLPLEERIIEGFYFEIGELEPGVFRVAAFESPTKPSITSNPVDPSRIERLRRMFQSIAGLREYRVEYESPSDLKAQGSLISVRGIRANVSKSDGSRMTLTQIEQLIRNNLISSL